MRRLLAWFRAHRVIKWSLRVVLAVYAAHLWLDWTAEREWQQYRNQARSRGVKLSFAEFATPEVPATENFAELPMFKAAYAALVRPVIDPFELPGASSHSLPSAGNPIKRTPVDWVAWQQHFKSAKLISDTTGDAVADVLRALDHYQPTVDEWREWQHRPQSRFPVNWKANPFTERTPARTIVQSAGVYFCWRMRAHLAQRNSVAAMEDFRDAFQAYRALSNEPQLSLALVRTNVLSEIAARVGGGLAEHAWSDDDLRAIDEKLAPLHLLDEYRLGMSCERSCLNFMYDDVIANGSGEMAKDLAKISSFSGGQAFLFNLLLSKHKIRDNQVRTNHYFDELLERVTDHGVDFERKTPSGPENIAGIAQQWHYPFLEATTPVFGGIEGRYLRTQALVAQARITIALERYHLAHGVFPESLDELVPAFLDEPLLDPWNGKPMKYRRNKADSFLLYSVGKDREDNGGAIDRSKSETQQRDAVWLYAPP